MDDHTSPRLKQDFGRLKPHNLKRRLMSNDEWPLCEQAAAYILMFGESLGYWGGRVYTGHSLNARSGVWWLTVRATYKGKPQVCFMSGATQQDAIKHFAVGLVYDHLNWQADKFKAKP